MSLYRRGSRWVVDYWQRDPSGTRRHIRRSLPPEITDEADAQKFAAVILGSEGRKTVRATSTSTVNELFPQYLSWYQLHRAVTSYRDIKGVWTLHLKPHLGRHVAQDIEASHIEAYKAARAQEIAKHNKDPEKVRKIGNRTINKEVVLFFGFLRWCSRHVRQFPRRTWDVEQLPYERPLPKILTPDEARRFLAAADEQYRPLFLVMFVLGLRQREARLLKWEDVDFEAATLRVIKKGGKEKILAMPRILYDVLSHVPRLDGSPYCFPSPRTARKGEPITDLRRAVERARKAAGITKRVHPHLFRHSISAHMLARGVDIRTIQVMLGHASVTTTQWYTQVDVQGIRDAQAAMGWEPVYQQEPERTKNSKLCISKGKGKRRKLATKRALT